MDRDDAKLLREGMASPAFGVVLRWMQEIADEMGKRYDSMDIMTNPSAFYRAQAYREIVNEIIPAKMTAVLNMDKHPSDTKWSFSKWWNSVTGNVSR